MCIIIVRVFFINKYLKLRNDTYIHTHMHVYMLQCTKRRSKKENYEVKYETLLLHYLT